jgi:hypothetical protein
MAEEEKSGRIKVEKGKEAMRNGECDGLPQRRWGAEGLGV